MKEIDKKATEAFGISTLNLMENAGKGLAEAILKYYPASKRIAVLCGKGNNGGDGLVAARYLSETASVAVFLLCNKNEISEDAKVNLDSFKGKLFEVTGEEG